jgi:1-deoxy-D-xylulose-5-phosphate synthase
MIDWKTPFKAIPVGTGRKLRGGDGIAILTIGHPGNFATAACDELSKENIYPAHYDLRFVKPLDQILLHEVFSNFKKIITVEDGCIMGGMGSAVAEFMIDNSYSAEIIRLGIPDKFIEHGEQKELYAECGFDKDAIVDSVRNMLKVKEKV